MSLYIIHFSDIHIKSQSDLIMDRVDCLKRTCAGSILDNSDVILVISGDIAYSGNPQQYKAATTLVNKVSTYLKTEKNSRVQYVLVPGNHDCDFTQETQAREKLLHNIKPDADVSIYNAVVSVQEQYFEFAKQYDSVITNMITKKEFNLPEGNVLFLLINTAWMSTKNEVQGSIIIPAFSIPDINTDKYKMVVAVFHHPEDWFNPDYKQDFISFIRKNADFALVGHEHIKDNYEKTGKKFSVIYNHGKELQNSEDESSEFSIIEFHDSFDKYCINDFFWDEKGYTRKDGEDKSFTPNRLINDVAFRPNKEALSFSDDFGVVLHHFAKDTISLSDLFIWPELNKVTYKIDKKTSIRIKDEVFSELTDNYCSIIIGRETSGKTTLAKKIYAEYADYDSCCLYIDGKDFDSVDPKRICIAIENKFVQQYKADAVDEYRRLSKNEKVLILDNFDKNKFHGEKRRTLFKAITDMFGKSYVFISSELELTTFLTSSIDPKETNYTYYEILPLGNRKRKELIEKWYSLNTDGYDENILETKIEDSIKQVNTFLGNGSGFLPAYPLFVLSVLASNNSITPTYNGSQYGFLYETMIQKSLSYISAEYKTSGTYNIDIGIISNLAFHVLQEREACFSKDELNQVVEVFNNEKKEDISPTELIDRMCKAGLLYHDSSEGDVYRFKYPYVFYYFAGRYIAYHYDETDVNNMIEYMSERLYIESYGNIMIFVCHFANNKNVVDTILLNAYATLEKYNEFDFAKNSPTVKMLADLMDSMMPKVVGSAIDVTRNKETQLATLDAVGINDGTVHDEEIIDETISEDEKDFAAIAASFKTMEVLGQILQNYPGDISGNDKIQIISEMHKMSMRTVQALITALGQFEDEFVEFIVSHSTKKGYNKTDTEKNARKFIHFLTAGMAQGMISQVAQCLNSRYLLPAAQESLIADGSISAKLIYLDLKVNKIKKFELREIKDFKEELEHNKERFALCVLGNIMSSYLNYNDCDYQMRSKICSMFNFSEKTVVTSRQSHYLEEII